MWNISSLGASRLVFGQGLTSGTCTTSGTFAGVYIHSTSVYRQWGCGGGYDYGSLSVSAAKPYISITRVNKNLANWATNYLNGSNQTGSASSGTLQANPTAVGARPDGAQPFIGYISEIIVFDRALKSNEITNIQQYLSQKYNIKLD